MVEIFSDEDHYPVTTSSGEVITEKSPIRVKVTPDLRMRGLSGWSSGVIDAPVTGVWDPTSRTIQVERADPESLAHEIGHSKLHPFLGDYRLALLKELEAVIFSYYSTGSLSREDLEGPVGALLEQYVEIGGTPTGFQQVVDIASRNVEEYLKTGKRLRLNVKRLR